VRGIDCVVRGLPVQTISVQTRLKAVEDDADNGPHDMHRHKHELQDPDERGKDRNDEI
jgi:hypothetical protein